LFYPIFISPAYAELAEEESYESLILDSIRFISSLPEAEMSDIRKRILHLQIDILTDLTIQSTIQVELRRSK